MSSFPVCFPVWAVGRDSDPYRAAIDAITSGGYEPEHEAALVQSVFDAAHAARYRAEAELSPLHPVPFSELREAVKRLAVCHG